MAIIGARKRKKFLAELSVTGKMLHSMKVAELSEGAVYRMKKADPAFAAEIEQARLQAGYTVEDQLITEMMGGSVEVIQKFAVVPVLDSDGKETGQFRDALVERRVKRRDTAELKLKWLQLRHPDYKPSQTIEVEGKQTILVLPDPEIGDNDFESQFPAE